MSKHNTWYEISKVHDIGLQNIGIKLSDFVAKTQFLSLETSKLIFGKVKFEEGITLTHLNLFKSVLSIQKLPTHSLLRTGIKKLWEQG